MQEITEITGVSHEEAVSMHDGRILNSNIDAGSVVSVNIAAARKDSKEMAQHQQHNTSQLE